MNKEMGEINFQKVHAVKGEINELLSKEEIMWKQRSRALWLAEGDKNTSFFHKKATSRKARNSIKGLEDANGIWQTSPEKIEEICVQYYQSLFSTDGTAEIDSFLEGMNTRVTQSMNAQLLLDFSSEEVNIALQQMHPLKSPGPDGLPTLFYQKYWEIVGADITQEVLHILNSGHMPLEVNHTHLALIPKVKFPSKINEFRPISLCNVIYKLVSKVLSNRLKKLLPSIVSENQSAFVAGRLIIDNILVAFETMHTIKTKNQGKDGFMAFKLDMTKAFDRVEWNFLGKIMLKMGFHSRWVDLLMMCITTAFFSVKIDGHPRGHFRYSRGIRQGDPLSPYLFILCAEGLSYGLNREVTAGRLQGVKACRGGPSITHLFFADDSLLFSRATEHDNRNLMQVLKNYEKASGQLVDTSKSCLYFSPNTTTKVQKAIFDTVGVEGLQHHDKYIGLPAMVGQTRKQILNYLTDNVRRKIGGWKEQTLS